MPLDSSIIQAFHESGLTQEELAERVNVRQPTISDWLLGKRSPRGRNLEKLKEVLGLTRRSTDEAPVGPVRTGTVRSTDAEKEFIYVPVFGKASAGPGMVPPDKVERYERMTGPEFQRIFRHTPPDSRHAERYGFWEVRGDSAAPVYFENELVPVEVIGPTQDFEDDLLYVFRWRNTVMLKRLRRLMNDEIRAVSLNPSIDPLLIRPDGEHEFSVLGRVIQPEKQQLYAAMVGRAFAIQQEVYDVIRGRE